MAKTWTVEEVGTKLVNGVRSEHTLAEKEAIVAKWNAEEDKEPAKKLEKLRGMRVGMLGATDYLGAADQTMTQEMKDFRQDLRDIPQNYTTEEEYDALLATDSSGKLTHSIWSKP
jgi:hypothetical protein